MKPFDVFWGFPVCKKIKSKLIFLVYSVILSQCFAFYLKQINIRRVISIEKINKNQVICIFLILALIISIPAFLIWLRSIFLMGRTITLDFEYDDFCLLGKNAPIENMSVSIFRNGVFLEDVYTNELGQISLSITDNAEYTYSYYWMGLGSGIKQLDESTTETIEVVLETYQLHADLFWESDLSPLANVWVDVLYLNGTSWVVITNVHTNAGGRMEMPLDGLFLGEFKFDNQVDTFVIDQQTLVDAYSEYIDFYIVPILKKSEKIKAMLCLGREKQFFSQIVKNIELI